MTIPTSKNLPGSTLTLIFFEGCPTTPRILSLLEELGQETERIDQRLLPPGHPLRHYSSPTLLRGTEILFGSRLEGDGGCSLALPDDDEIRKRLQEP
ncbi:MAG: hypothetical protein ACYCTV_09945 [Leptospirales bacterium]